MDMFIPDEYVAKRRAEKMAAAEARKRLGAQTGSDCSGGRRTKGEGGESQLKPHFDHEQHQHDGAGAGLRENLIYSCFSA